ncbi:MAG: type II toxin-antitoxin system HicB family antitoxin [Nitrospirae bacterium]|nr:type II toxin-antitoxin system HicB family antitoxin [Nitrospirota bacterium]
MSVRYTVIFEDEEGGGFHVYCPALPGCHSYGGTKDEALANIREAIEAYLESLKKDGLPFPEDSAEKVEVAA